MPLIAKLLLPCNPDIVDRSFVKAEMSSRSGVVCRFDDLLRSESRVRYSWFAFDEARQFWFIQGAAISEDVTSQLVIITVLINLGGARLADALTDDQVWGSLFPGVHVKEVIAYCVSKSLRQCEANITNVDFLIFLLAMLKEWPASRLIKVLPPMTETSYIDVWPRLLGCVGCGGARVRWSVFVGGEFVGFRSFYMLGQSRRNSPAGNFSLRILRRVNEVKRAIPTSTLALLLANSHGQGNILGNRGNRIRGGLAHEYAKREAFDLIPTWRLACSRKSGDLAQGELHWLDCLNVGHFAGSRVFEMLFGALPSANQTPVGIAACIDSCQ